MTNQAAKYDRRDFKKGIVQIIKVKEFVAKT